MGCGNMTNLCGALDFNNRAVDFSTLKRIRGSHGGGCAFINNEFGVLCDCITQRADEPIQPITVKYNNSLYTAAIIMDNAATGLESSTAQAVLEGYFEEGEDYFRRLDFSFALALYDGRCGELLLRKGYRGDKPLFYTVKEGTLYFSSSLRSLIRLYGGCVKISKQALTAHILAAPSSFPTGLFKDIRAVPSGGALICSALGQNLVLSSGTHTVCGDGADGELSHIPYTKKTDMRRILSDTMFAFGYPQFDCFLPSILAEIKEKKGSGVYSLNETVFSDYPEYAAERAETVGRSWGIDIRSAPQCDYLPTQRELKAIERAVDNLLDGMLSDASSPLCRIFDSELYERVWEQRDVYLRIRQKAMICQTQMWAQSFNLVFE